jgi:predicted TPR repeat methyltransferase
VYDTWQGDYDRQLLQQCDYQSPARMARLLTTLRVSMRLHWPDLDRPWVDLGAGTGLAGHALRELAIDLPLIAVDLSAAMLSHIDHDPYVACAALDVLDAPALRDLLPGDLPAQGAIAIGVTEHIVDLSRLFAACAALLPGGAPLVFSYCPLSADSPHDSQVFESFVGLHAHSRRHVSRTLAEQGFVVFSEQDGPGYQTAGNPVRHCLVAAQRR